TGARVESTSIREDDYGPAFGGGFGSGPDIQVEAILTGRSRCRPSSRAARATLHTSRSEVLRVSNTGPRCDRLRRPPAKWTHWRRSEGNALEHTDLGTGIRGT